MWASNIDIKQECKSKSTNKDKVGYYLLIKGKIPTRRFAYQLAGAVLPDPVQAGPAKRGSSVVRSGGAAPWSGCIALSCTCLGWG